MKPRLLAPRVRMLITERTFYSWGLIKVPIEPGEQDIPAEAALQLEASGYGTILETSAEAERVMAPRLESAARELAEREVVPRPPARG